VLGIEGRLIRREGVGGRRSRKLSFTGGGKREGGGGGDNLFRAVYETTKAKNALGKL